MPRMSLLTLNGQSENVGVVLDYDRALLDPTHGPMVLTLSLFLNQQMVLLSRPEIQKEGLEYGIKDL